MLPADRYAAALLAEATAFAGTIDGVATETRVPTCPEWTLADLTRHVGRAYYWVSQIITTGAMVAPDGDIVDGDPPPDGHAEWLTAGARRLVAAVAEVGPATEVWTWAPDKRAVFWLRRLSHETVVHRADAAIAAGRDFDVAVDLAVDGVTEWLEILATPMGRRIAPGLTGTGQTLHFHGTDTDSGEWLVRRTPDGLALSYEHVKADVAVRASARDLLLALYGRRPLTDLTVFGDAELLVHWREHTKF